MWIGALDSSGVLLSQPAKDPPSDRTLHASVKVGLGLGLGLELGTIRIPISSGKTIILI